MPSLVDLVRYCAYSLDDAAVLPVVSATSTTITIGGLANSETDASTARYDNRWLYVMTGSGAGQQRWVKPGSYVPSTGQVTLEVGFNTQPVNNDLVVLTSLFPVAEGLVAGEDIGYRRLLNHALARLLVEDRIELAITTDDSYPLSGNWPWLNRQERLVGIREPSPVSGRRAVPANWRNPRVVQDGQTVTLELTAPFSVASGNMILDVLRPGNTWIKTGSTWAETDPNGGLVNATDETSPTLTFEEINTVFQMLAFEALMHRSPGRPNGNWAARYEQARADAERLTRYDRTLFVPETAAAPAAATSAAGAA